MSKNLRVANWTQLWDSAGGEVASISGRAGYVSVLKGFVLHVGLYSAAPTAPDALQVTGLEDNSISPADSPFLSFTVLGSTANTTDLPVYFEDGLCAAGPNQSINLQYPISTSATAVPNDVSINIWGEYRPVAD